MKTLIRLNETKVQVALAGTVLIGAVILLYMPVTQRLETPVVAWIGTSAEQNDKGFQRLRQALARSSVASAGNLTLRHVQVRDHGPEAAADDLRHTVSPRPKVWVAPTADAARAVRLQMASAALVFATYPDPVALGLVQSLQKPGMAATGVMLDDELHAKRMELLQDAFPGTRTIGVLLDSSWIETRSIEQMLMAPAAALGLSVRIFVVDEPEQLPRMWQTGRRLGVEAWYLPPTYIAYRAERLIIEELARSGWPAIHSSVAEVSAGALMAYAQDPENVFEQLADLVARIVAGEDPAVIPVQRPQRFVLAVRPRTDNPLLRLQPSVVRRADRVF